MERIRTRLAEVRSRLAEIYRAKDEAEVREHTEVRDANAAFEKQSKELNHELQQKIESINKDITEERKRLAEKWRRRLAKLTASATRAKEKIEQESHARITVLEEQQRATHFEKTHGNDEKVNVFKAQCAELLVQLQEREQAAGVRQQHIQNFVREYGVGVTEVECEALNAPLTVGNYELIEKRLRENETMLAQARTRLRRLVPPMLAYTLLIVIHALAGIYVHTTYNNLIFTLLVGASLILSLPIAYQIYHSKSGEVLKAGIELMKHLGTTMLLIDKHKELLADHEAKGLQALDNERIQRICETYEKLEKQVQQVNKLRADSIAKLEARRAALSAKMQQHRKDTTDAFEIEAKKRETEMRADCEKRIADCNRNFNERKTSLRKELETKTQQLTADWNKTLCDLEKFCEDERQRAGVAKITPNAEVTLPSKFLQEVPIGDVQIALKELNVRCDPEGPFSIPSSLATLSLPVCLSFPLNGSLLLRASPYLRKQALDTQFSTIIRLLSSFPPAKAKMTIVDPIGLGQNFAALMHLADYDESLVNGRIWSDGVHIERKMTELTEHMEKVIQKYLRNRYATIDEYNREAGELAEPYRFLIIADFPTGFSELALERLAAIITSGVRCGVYTIMLHDTKQKFPQILDETQLRRNGVVIIETGTGLAVDEEVLARPLYQTEPPPSPTTVEAVINAIGKQCREAGRVQVPFDVVCPKPEKFWTESSEQSVRVPLGKTGADRLQYLEIGRGTAQHALLAGKTGSGKSNLVHVIITSAAMWYSPKEVEFYLIDFKKGVEFKTYATNRLPHVRVVAIESDREFGLSVLRRIDKELTRRGELFRKCRVQDFASYRKSAGAEHLPRTMLIIDEFQEFFVDDDEVAQDAALLLDRIVRQGRAFGIHVVLGSQTLGGTYTLSKSTLGQMAVRIALQCSEADSYLILNDDNSAAALLSRPGEAIYNDQSGLVEGNNPFQAVFLPKDGQEPQLRALRAKAVQEGLESVGTIAIFEGSSLSDIRNNPLLRETAIKQPVLSEGDKVWLGEANAVKGPTEIEFTRQSGSNMLVVGHRGGSEVAMCCANIMSLAASNYAGNIHIRVLDGTAPDSGARERLNAVKAALNYDIEVVDPRQTQKTIEELSALIKSRQEDESGNQEKYYLLILGIEKFRMLRQDNEFDFGSSDDGTSPGKAFNEILIEGPLHGIHTMVWCDTLGNLNRTFSRKTLREFENRVLFQMSATDSSELIDSPAANRLGLYNALLYSVQTGGIEKFRPYSLPDMDLVEELARNLAARSRVAQNNPAPKTPKL